MDLVNAAMGLKQADMMAKIQYRVAAKILDNQRKQGAAALKLLQAADVSRAGDELAAAATGLGGSLDVYG